MANVAWPAVERRSIYGTLWLDERADGFVRQLYYVKGIQPALMASAMACKHRSLHTT